MMDLCSREIFEKFQAPCNMKFISILSKSWNSPKMKTWKSLSLIAWISKNVESVRDDLNSSPPFAGIAMQLDEKIHFIFEHVETTKLSRKSKDARRSCQTLFNVAFQFSIHPSTKCWIQFFPHQDSSLVAHLRSNALRSFISTCKHEVGSKDELTIFFRFD